MGYNRNMNIVDKIKTVFTSENKENEVEKAIQSNSETGWSVISSTSPYSSTKSKRDLYYGIVYSCIDAIATSVANVDIDLMREDGMDRVEVYNHPAIQLLERPNAFQTKTDLLYLISSHIDTFGTAYLYPVYSKSGRTKGPIELWALNPSQMQVVVGNSFIQGYVYTNGNGVQVPFEPTDIIPISRPNPFNQTIGISTIEMARITIDADVNAQEWNASFYKNGAMLSGVLTTDGLLKPDSFQKIKEQWKNLYSGSRNAYKTAILDSGVKFQELSLRQKDMDFVSQRQFTRDEILSIFKVPKTIVAITDDVNRANAETSDYVFAKRVIEPRLKLIEDKLNRFLLPLFANTMNMEFEFESPVPEDRTLEMNYNNMAVNKWLTINEVRARDGFEPVDGGDILYAQGLLTPIGEDTDINNISDDEDMENLDSTSEEDFSEENNTDNATKTASPKGKQKVSNERLYMLRKMKFFRENEPQVVAKLTQHYRTLTSRFKKKDFVISGKSVAEIEKDIIPELESWRGVLTQIIYDIDKSAMVASISNVKDTFGVPVLALEHSGAIAWLDKRSKDSSDSIRNTLLEKARDVIQQQLDQDITSPREIKLAIGDIFANEEEWRIDRIARTELATAYSEGSLETYRSSGIVKQVKWIVANDERTCPVCMANGNVVVSLGQTFPSGNSNAPAHPNCRCDLVPVL